MKNFFILIIIASALMTLISCGGGVLPGDDAQFDKARFDQGKFSE